MDSLLKKSLIVIGVLIVIVPIGILITWNNEDAWGEWGEVNDPNSNTTWTPHSFFESLFPDYNVDGWSSKGMASIGYWISAIVGVILVMGIILVFGKISNRNNNKVKLIEK
ncbi:MAG: PDGLE domain-containing protein [Promethearchaeota archaeon]